MYRYLTIENILTSKECTQIIATYEPLLIASTSLKGQFSYNFTNIKLSEIIFERLKNVLLNNICEINSKWCIDKYIPNHDDIIEMFDGNILYDDRISQYTLLLYLNDDFIDGCTIINDPYCKEKMKIKPLHGSALILDQNIYYHAEKVKAEKVKSNSKYILKADLMVKTNNLHR